MGSSLSACCLEEKVSQGFSHGEPAESSAWRMFSYKELHAATNGFREKHKLGEGGLGSVYWGKTADGSQIAVKSLKSTNSKAAMEFAAEVEILGRIRHKNLLGLRGYCVGPDQRLIVYDYIPNLSLMSHLHGQVATDRRLDWRKRMKIIIGSAEGLVYLHDEAEPPIIHHDIKSSNVLLDSDFAPLVADFGFAKLMPDGVSHMTNRVKGALGYLAPEYAMWGKASESSDVYSFGILILEIVTGRRPIERLPDGVKRTLTEWTEPLLASSSHSDLVDPHLRGAFDGEHLHRVLHAALLSMRPDPDHRPNMRHVLDLLRGTAPAADPIRNATLGSVDREVAIAEAAENADDEDDEDDDEEVEEDGDGNDADVEDEVDEVYGEMSMSTRDDVESRYMYVLFRPMDEQRMVDVYGQYGMRTGSRRYFS